MSHAKTITLHITDLPGGGVVVNTSAPTPMAGVRLSPAQALATDLLATCGHRASDVRHWQTKDPAWALVERLINPEEFGYSVSAEVFAQAAKVLGRDTRQHNIRIRSE